MDIKQENNSYKKNYAILQNESGKKKERITSWESYSCRKEHRKELKAEYEVMRITCFGEEKNEIY